MGLAIVFVIFVFCVVYKDEIGSLISKLIKKFSKKNEDINNIEEVKKDNNDKVIKEVKESPETKIVEEPKEDVIEKKEYVKPSVNLLSKNKNSSKEDETQITNNINIIKDIFNDEKINIDIKEVTHEVAFTYYQIELGKGTKVNDVVKMKHELEVGLKTNNVEFLTPYPNKTTIGLGVPNKEKSNVTIREVIRAMNKDNNISNSKIVTSLGKDMTGNIKYIDIEKSSHILVAGRSMSGKTTFLNNIIVSNLIRNNPEEVKLVLIDTAKNEFGIYDELPHLLSNSKKNNDALNILKNLTVEIDHRYDILKNENVNNIKKYNEKNKNVMPYILVIIDEYSDTLFRFNEVKEYISKILDSGSTCGINLILSTQDIGSINDDMNKKFGSKVIFDLVTKDESRFYLGVEDAEHLDGKGDLLYKNPSNEIIHVQASNITLDEINKVVNFIKNENK